MTLFSIVLIFIFSSLNISMYRAGKSQRIRFMSEIAQSDGMLPFKRPFPKPLPPDREFEAPMQSYFSVLLNPNDKAFKVIVDEKFTYSEDEVNALVTHILSQNKIEGTIGTQYYRIQDKPYGKIIVLLDISGEINTLTRLIVLSLFIGSISLLVIFLIALFLSKWSIRPVSLAFERQKQFVADASHELKTPLTVIATNADVLESEIGTNKWLEYIKMETKRMSTLVGDLLYLEQVDSEQNNFHLQLLNLSDLIITTLLPFESVFFEAGKTLELNIQEGIFIKGDENLLKQLIIILLDNALKYSDQKGAIKVNLCHKSKKRILSVFNTGEGIAPSEEEKIFERFYRVDASRARQTGGFGLGLSIAKSIVDKHNAHIYFESDLQKGTTFFIAF